MNCLYDNYSARRIHPTGLKVVAYTQVFGPGGGVFYANGQKFVGRASSATQPPISPALAVAIPSCSSCG